MRRAVHFVSFALIWSALSAMTLASVPAQRMGSCERLTLPQGSSASVLSAPHSLSSTSDPHPYVSEFFGAAKQSHAAVATKLPVAASAHLVRVAQILLRHAQHILSFGL